MKSHRFPYFIVLFWFSGLSALFAQVTVTTPWEITLTVSCGTTTRLTFGTKAGATDSLDTGLDDLAPPAPPSGIYSHFQISGFFDKLSSDFRSGEKSPNSWVLKIEQTEGAGGTISWNSAGFPSGDHPGTLTMNGVDMLSSTGIFFSGDKSYTISYTAPTDNPGDVITKPGTPTGETHPTIGVNAGYTTTGSTSRMGHTMEYRFNWGDGTSSDWSLSTSAGHNWSAIGAKIITVEARCQVDTDSMKTSDELRITVRKVYSAWESFNYQIGDLNGQGGAEDGWEGPWHTQSGLIRVVKGNLLQEPGENSVQTVHIGPPENSYYRDLGQKWPDDGGPYWISFAWKRLDRNHALGYDGYGGGIHFDLGNNDNDYLFFGSSYLTGLIGLEGSGVSWVTTDVPDTLLSWVVGKLDMNGTADNDSVFLWVNPNPSAEPKTADAGARGVFKGSNGFSRVFIRTAPYTISLFDMIRIGYSFSYVASAFNPELSVVKPGTPEGEDNPTVGISQTYTTTGSPSDPCHPMEYRFNWGDGTSSSWSTSLNANHAWNIPGARTLTVDARCRVHANKTSTSDAFEVTVKEIDTSVQEKGLTDQKPIEFALGQNYPNPFNPVTTIGYSLPEADFIVIRIYDPNGKTVKKLYEGDQNAGNHAIQWDAEDESGNKISSGIYFYRLESSRRVLTKKLIFIK